MPWDLRPTGMPVPEVDIEAQPRQSEGHEGGRDPGKKQSHLNRETMRPEEECKRTEQQHQHQHQRQMRQRRSHQPRELEVETLERESSVL